MEHLEKNKKKMESELADMVDKYENAYKTIEEADSLRDEVNMLRSSKKILSAAKVKKIDKIIKPSLLNKDNVVLKKEDYEAKKEAEKILKEARDMLSESINEKCRRLTLEDEYRKIISDPYIQEYLEYKKCIGSHNLDREQEIDYREIDIGDMD